MNKIYCSELDWASQQSCPFTVCPMLGQPKLPTGQSWKEVLRKLLLGPLDAEAGQRIPTGAGSKEGALPWNPGHGNSGT